MCDARRGAVPHGVVASVMRAARTAARRARRFRLRRHRHFLHQLQPAHLQNLQWPDALAALHPSAQSSVAESPRTVELHCTSDASASDVWLRRAADRRNGGGGGRRRVRDFSNGARASAACLPPWPACAVACLPAWP